MYGEAEKCVSNKNKNDMRVNLNKIRCVVSFREVGHIEKLK